VGKAGSREKRSTGGNLRKGKISSQPDGVTRGRGKLQRRPERELARLVLGGAVGRLPLTGGGEPGEEKRGISGGKKKQKWGGGGNSQAGTEETKPPEFKIRATGGISLKKE